MSSWMVSTWLSGKSRSRIAVLHSAMLRFDVIAWRRVRSGG